MPDIGLLIREIDVKWSEIEKAKTSLHSKTNARVIKLY